MTSYDDIVIGSGLTALGAVTGLPLQRRILLIAGPEAGQLSHYDAGCGVPNAYLGFGGLGRYWHGVIPTGLNPNPDSINDADFERLFKIFYPRTDASAKIGEPWLFVPRHPIRTPAAWKQAKQMRAERLTIVCELAQSFSTDGHSVTVRTHKGRYSGRRLWIAAGTLHTPKLLAASLDRFEGVRPAVSDHAIAYIGQIDRDMHPHIDAPHIERSAEGFWTRAVFNSDASGLFTLKPARFSYRRLDHGIEQRAAFGLPTGGVVAKLAKASSLGLVAEALYNKFGLFPDARRLSVYAQIRMMDAYSFDADRHMIAPRAEAIRSAIDHVRRNAVWHDETLRSRQPELFVNGIHLHNSIDVASLKRRGINLPNSQVQVIDASVTDNIGSEHHSFKLMAAAFAKARQS